MMEIEKRMVNWKVSLLCIVLGVIARILVYLNGVIYPSVDKDLLPLVEWNVNWSSEEVGEDDSGNGNINNEDGDGEDSILIQPPDDVLQDLFDRLRLFQATDDAASRPLVDVDYDAATYGISQDLVRFYVDYWLSDAYNWRKQEEYFNSFKQSTKRINGLIIHYFHITCPKDSNRNAIPLMLIHGWPGSFTEFFPYVVKILTSYQDQHGNCVFDLIIPSIPGFGMSEDSHKSGFDPVDAAVIMVKLLRILGYKKSICQGGDFGSVICSAMAQIAPNDFYGIHLNMLMVPNPPLSMGGPLNWLLCLIAPSLALPKSDQGRITPITDFMAMVIDQTGYSHLQATKPDTIGLGLNDSPAFLLGFFLEKFVVWSYNKNIKEAYTPEQLINNAMVYWLGRSGQTSARLYKEVANSKATWISLAAPIKIPVGLADFPGEMIRPPRSWFSAKYYDIATYDEYDKGGHFPAMEVPDLLCKSIIHFIQELQERNVIEKFDLKQKPLD